MPHVVANGVRLYYEIRGEGPPLVLIGGTGNDHRLWEKQVTAFHSRFRCISFDNRGSGSSEITPSGYSISDLAADALGLMDAVGVDAAHVAGFSMGGSIAMAMAMASPSRVLTLALHSTSGRLYPSIKHRYRVLIPVTRGGDPSLWAEATVITAFRDSYINAHPEAIEAEVGRRRKLRAEMTADQVEGLLGHYIAFSTFDPWDRLAEIRVPTLVTVGTGDAVTPPEYAMDVHRRISGSEIRLFKDAPHRTPTFAAEELNEASLAFLSKHGAAIR